MKLLEKRRKLNTAYEETYVFTNNEDFVKFKYSYDEVLPGAVVVDYSRYLNVELDLTWIPKNWTVYSVKLRFHNLEQTEKCLYVKNTTGLTLRGTEVYGILKSEKDYYEIDLAAYFDTDYTSKKYITIDGLGKILAENYHGALSLFTEGESKLEPQLIITYYENDKLLSGKTINGNVGKSLSYNVNLLTGKSVYTKPLLQIVNTVLPINLELLFDGNNSRFTYDQSVVKNDEGYEYTDGFGYRHQFITSLNDGDIYFDTAGTGLILTKSLIDYTIKDENENYLSFDSNGLLFEIVKIISNNRFSILLTRDNLGRLTGISESLFFEEDDMPTITSRVNISYTDTNITITSTGFNNVVLTKDDNGNIVSITEEDNRLSEYGYNDDNLLITARYDSGENVEFTYDTFKRVTDIINKVGDNVVSKDTLDYHNLLTYNTNFFNTKMAYVFDEDGLLIGSYEIVVEDNKEEKINFQYINREAHKIEVNVNSTKTYTRYKDIGIEGHYDLEKKETLEFDENLSKGDLKIKTNTKYELNLRYNYDILVYSDNSKSYIVVTQNGEKLLEEQLQYVRHNDIMQKLVFESKSNDDIEINIYHSYVIGKLNVKSVILTELKLIGTETVISEDIGAEVVIDYEKDDKVEKWYSLTDNKFSYGNLEILVPYPMYKEDLEQNLKNIGTDNSSYNIWYNHKRGLVVHTDNVKLIGSKSVNLEEIKLGNLTLMNNQYYLNYFDYSDDPNISNYLRTEYSKVYNGELIQIGFKKINKDFQVAKEVKDGITKENSFDIYGNISSEVISGGVVQLFKNYYFNKVSLYKEFTYINGSTQETEYTTDSNTGLITKIKYPNNLEELFEYVPGTTKLAKVSTSINGVINSNEIIYNKDFVTKYKGMNLGITQTYDGYNMIKQINNSSNIFINNMERNISATGIVLKKFEGQGNYFIKEEYDKYGNLFQISDSNTSSNFVERKKLFYSDKDVSLLDASDQVDDSSSKRAGSKLRKIIDLYTTDEALLYYDNDGKIKEIEHSSSNHPNYEHYVYDNYSRMSEINLACLDNQFIEQIEYENTYTQDVSKITSTVKYPDNGSIAFASLMKEFTKDAIGRVYKEQLVCGLKSIFKTYTFLRNGFTTSPLISNIKYTGTNDSILINLDYTYDEMGRITSIIGTNGIQNSYEYDLLGRLVRENNLKLNKTTILTYDLNGNILSKAEGAYTTGVLTPTETINYQYNSSYADVLSMYNDLPVYTSSRGNVVTINNVHLTWARGKLLSRVEKSSNEYVNMSYDADGNRYRKEYYKNGTTITHEFVIHNNRIIKEIITGGPSAGTIYYMYHGTEIVGFVYKNKQYYFHKNLQGDIIELYDLTSVIARYVYDAWGNHKIFDKYGNEITDESKEALINPFRYKGYYYDVETGLAMVGQRYYSPELCRFIQPADVSTLSPSSINGLNLYSYANNNPVGVAYGSSGFSGSAGGEIVSSIASSVGGLNSGYHGAVSNSSKWHFNPNSLTKAFEYIENGFSIIEGALAGYRNVKHLPQLENLSKISKKLMIGGIVLGLVVDAHNNFSNEQLSLKEQIIGFAVDGLYTVGSAALSYGISSLITGVLALIPGVGLFAVLGGTLVSIGVMELIDWAVEEYGWLDSIKDWIESW